ncbi:MAG TPA: hypothetical protein PLP14_03480, partial [Chitinophagaceae bacterium]|nr:hypothetical protein [Chitinophagaceae bacterium]
MKWMVCFGLFLLIGREASARRFSFRFNDTSTITEASYKNESISVSGSFLVNHHTTFSNCTLYFTPNSKIIVGPNATLTIHGSTLQAACDAMWDGIYANDASAQIVIDGNSVLQDMENGVVVSEQGKLNANQVDFTNNYISIQLKNLSANYTGTIFNCNFLTNSTPLLAPHVQSRGEHGIVIENCLSTTIGNPTNAATKNHFEHLYNGIYIVNAIPLPNPFPLGGLPEISIHTEYNTFTDIAGGGALWDLPSENGPTPNLNYKGAAIFGNNQNNLYSIKLYYTGSNSVSSPDFLTCQKAILVNAFSTQIQQAVTQNTDAAVLQYQCEHHKQEVLNSQFLNTYLGVLVQGNSGGGQLFNNNIQLLAHPVITPTGSSMYWGKGIELNYFTNTQAAANLSVSNNVISSDEPDWIVGLNVANSPSGLRNENHIVFNTISNTVNPYPYPVLRGIQVHGCKSNVFEKNTVNGAINADALMYRRSTGVYMERNDRNTYNCNVNDYLYYGAYVVGNNAGNNNQFNNNKFRSSHYGILLRHLGTNGSLGDIGSQAIYDANNKFYDQGISSVNYNKRVHRITTPSLCDINTPYVSIYTDVSNLQQIHSTSTMGFGVSCEYKVPLQTGSFSFTFQCIPGTIQGNEEPEEGVDDIELAIAIAEDSVNYSEYSELAAWMDELELYRQLEYDDSVRLTHPILDSFYMSRQQTTIDKINQIDQLIGELSDSSVYSNKDLFLQKLAEAQSLNDSLQTTEYYVQNEQWMNTQYLTAYSVANYNPNAEIQEQIKTLAYACPYLEGKAVFKARTLNSLLNPLANYDDLELCNNAGVNKAGDAKGLFDQENEGLDSMANADGLQLIYAKEKRGIKIFPNP